MNDACTTPTWSAWPCVSLFIAPLAMLKPDPAWSIASTLIVVLLNVSCQHDPQLGESHPVAKTDGS